ncbi:MAG: FAD-dependent oxidoreductase, partial [Acidobacteriota bacterium]|nr:FAD-dependent oxidoreductase [Acidobacteriota bacterium]
MWDVVVIGSGFAGSLLARLLKLQGRNVLLVERGTHPRFALGESSTPLAALSLERLARCYDQPDLSSLAAHGRWCRDLPMLERGLKRGFSFYRHTPGRSYLNSDVNDARFLVAASPDAETADCQWLRSDVDAHFVQQAMAVGVEYCDRSEVIAVEERADSLRVGVRQGDRQLDLEARFVVDGSGAGEVSARALDLEGLGESVGFSSRLVYGHFDGVTPFAEAAVRDGAYLSRGPFPEHWSAVHHMIDEGWIYSLRFDGGRTSVGL